MSSLLPFIASPDEPGLSQIPLEEAIAALRGERLIGSAPRGFEVKDLHVWSLEAMEYPAGEEAANIDDAVRRIVRTRQAQGAPLGMIISREDRRSRVNLVSPALDGNPAGWISGALPAARWKDGGSLGAVSSKLLSLPFQMALAGHPGVSAAARLETLLENAQSGDFSVFILAMPTTPASVAEARRSMLREVQFLQDEHLARPGLEQDNHALASACLELLEASVKRTQEAAVEGGWVVRFLLTSQTSEDLRNLSAQISSLYGTGGGNPEPLRWQEVASPRGMTFLTTKELSAYLRLPRRDLPGLKIERPGSDLGHQGRRGTPAESFSVSVDAEEPDRPIYLGRVVAGSGRADHWLRLPADSFLRHALVAGMTGSGKSTTVEQILLELWRSHRVPWLVLEPGMNPGYRRLLRSEIGTDLKGYVIGDSRFRQLPLNPLSAPPGTLLHEHIGSLFAVLTAAFELVPPMPEVLKLAVEETYRNHGWDLAGVVPDKNPPPFLDLIETVERLVRGLGYSGEIASNIHAGLVLRLKSLLTGGLATALDSPDRLDLEELTSTPTIVELGTLANSQTQSLVLGLLSLQLRHHWRLRGRASRLRHLTVIEEAHRLLRRPRATGTESSQAQAVEDIGHLVAELRGMGAGVLIADQTPSELLPSAISNTSIKIIHRLDHPDDRQLAARSANLPEQIVDLAGSFRPGEGIVRIDDRSKPYRVRFPNPARTYGDQPLPDWPRLLEPISPAVETGNCPICARANCAGRALSMDSDSLLGRLQVLRDLIGNGHDAIRSWASREVSGITTDFNSITPLCFLVGLALAAGLSEQVVKELEALYPEFST